MVSSYDFTTDHNFLLINAYTDWRTKAVTHVDRRAKANIRIVFVPYGNQYHQPRFNITVVKDFKIFWTNIEV
jgi:hypothetical protein